jgi:ketosteroid isomerase-like protein
MSRKNKELVRKINEAFLKRNVDEVSDYIDDKIKWTIVGMPVITGRSNFIETMEMMDLESPDIKIKNVIAEGDYVVVESLTNQDPGGIDASEKPYTPSYCDVYYIKNGKLQELTTYMVDITLTNGC